MIKVVIERDGWNDYKENAWCGALNTLDDIEKRGREEEAIEIIEKYFLSHHYPDVAQVRESNEVQSCREISREAAQ